MSYNCCNLPKQITTVNGKTVKYTYFADGTKYRKSIALVQLCSSVFFTAYLQSFSCYIGVPMHRKNRLQIYHKITQNSFANNYNQLSRQLMRQAMVLSIQVL